MQIRFLATLLSLGLCSQTALAADAAQLDWRGFSPDGRYLAFEQYGIHDGSAMPYAEIYLIDVQKNAYLSKPIEAPKAAELGPDELAEIGLAGLREQAQAAAQKALGKYKLEQGEPGTTLIYHPLHDIGANPDQVDFSPQLPLGGVSAVRYRLELEETEDESGSVDCFDLGKAKRFTLSLTNLDLLESQQRAQEKGEKPLSEANPRHILQADKSLPKSRGCVLDYRIERVYLYQDKALAVFLNQMKPGFEGQNMRYMVVTGTLPQSEK